MILNELMQLLPRKIFAIELLLVVENIKPVCRIEIEDRTLNKLTTFCSTNNLSLIKSDFKFVKTDDGKAMMMPANSPLEGGFFVYISKQKDDAINAKDAELSLDHKTFGKLLGYPACCIDFFIKHYEEAAKMHDDYTLLTLKDSDILDWRLNISLNFFDYRLISHFPHSFNCLESISLSQKIMDVLAKYDSNLAQQTKEELCTVVIYDDETGVHILKNIRKEQNHIYYADVMLTSPNRIFTLLKMSNKIKIITRNHLELYNDNVKTGELKGDVGILVFL